MPGSNPTRQRNIAKIEREAQALELRKAGVTYREIGEALGGITESHACHIVTDGLRRMLQPPADELRKVEVERVDRVQREAWQIMVDRTIPASVRLQAVDRVLRAMERRARLLGLDAPVKVQVEEVVTPDALAAKLIAAIEVDSRPVLEDLALEAGEQEAE